MRFSDTTQFQLPQPTKYANSDSSRFNSDESLSEEDSQTFVTPPSFSTSNQNTPSITSNDKSLTTSTNDNSLYRHIINTPHTNVSGDRSRHSSNNQTTSLPPLKSSEYFRFIESLRTCIMASQSTGNLKIKLHICPLGLRSSRSFCYMHGFVSYVLY